MHYFYPFVNSTPFPTDIFTSIQSSHLPEINSICSSKNIHLCWQPVSTLLRFIWSTTCSNTPSNTQKNTLYTTDNNCYLGIVADICCYMFRLASCSTELTWQPHILIPDPPLTDTRSTESENWTVEGCFQYRTQTQY